MTPKQTCVKLVVFFFILFYFILKCNRLNCSRSFYSVQNKVQLMQQFYSVADLQCHSFSVMTELVKYTVKSEHEKLI